MTEDVLKNLNAKEERVVIIEGVRGEPCERSLRTLLAQRS
jgi:hypothetical protein